jgi:cytochrome c553
LKAADEVEIESPDAIIVRSRPGNPVLGKVKSQVCQGCHGLRGYSVISLIPKLAGQYAHYIAKELRNYQEGSRSHQIMSAMAAFINDADLDDIAAHFSVQKKMSGGHAEENPIGKNLFLNGDVGRRILPCVNCHGADGKGRRPWSSIFPVIGGQHKDYLRVQLNNFRSDTRSNSPVAIMNLMTRQLTDEEIEGLADYISGR